MLFFPHHCISWFWKIIDKRREYIGQGFFITCHEFDKTYLVYCISSAQRSEPFWRWWKKESCKLPSGNAPTLVPHGPEAIQALGLCWQEGRTWFDLLAFRKAHSMLKTTVTISELWPTRKCIEIMLYIPHTTKQLLGPVCMQGSSGLQSFRQAKKFI